MTNSIKRVMISAGGSGIGLSLAKTFIECGAKVHISDIDSVSLVKAKEQYPSLGVFHGDMSCPKQVDEWFDTALDDLNGLDVLINNVGIAGPTASIQDITFDQWNLTLAVNLGSQFLCIKRAVEALKSSGRGTIINMSSVAGRLGYPYRTPYAASKWAVVGLTQSLALELAEYNITVNAILPGIVESKRVVDVIKAKAETLNMAIPQLEEEILEQVTLHRMVPIQTIADTAIFLCSEAGRSITGQSLNICAGIQKLC